MKLVADRQKLSQAFSTVSGFAARGGAAGVARFVKLAATDSGVTVTGTDLEVGCRASVEGVTMETLGAALLPVDRVGGMLKEVSDETLEIDASPRHVVIRGEQAEFKIAATPPDEFPDLPSFSGIEKFFVVSSPAIVMAMNRAGIATEEGSTRYALQCVLYDFDFDRKLLNIVGSDGRRLSKSRVGIDRVGGHSPAAHTTIMPWRSLRKIAQALPEQGTVRLHCRTNDVLLQTDRATFYCRLAEGRFPRWQDAIPAPRANKVSMVAGHLHKALRQAALMATEESRGVDFRWSDGSLTLSTNVADLGEARVRVPVAYENTPVTIRADHRYMADFLKVVDGDQNVEIDIGNGEDALLMEVDDGGSAYVLMPLTRDKK